jgi:hypothetical protein
MNKKNNTGTNEEMDIVLLFKKISDLFLNLILIIFRAFKKLLVNWKTIGLIIVLGAALGLITESIVEDESTKEASILLRINFDAGNYVYDAISLITQKIESEDEDFFSNDMGLSEDEEITEISIKPIIDLKDILKSEIKADEIRALFENLEFEDNIAMTEGFKSDYEYHVLTLDISSKANTSSLKKIIQYFNGNSLFLGLKERRLQSIASTIFNNEYTIKQIDKLIEKYGSTNNLENSSTQLYIDNKTYLPNELLKIKIKLEEQNEELKNERILSKETVMVINETNLLIDQDGLSDNKTVYYPILLVLIFIIASVVLKLYKYLDKLDRGV